MGATPPARQPRTESATADAARPASVENARPASAAPRDARHVGHRRQRHVDPRRAQVAPAASESARALPAAPCRGAERAGAAHGRLRTSPPSWSTQISGVEAAPAPQLPGERARLARGR